MPTLCFPSFLEKPEEERWLEQFSEPSGLSAGLSVFEDEKHVTIKADLPGLKAEEIEMSFERGILWIKGEKKEEEEEKSKKYYRKALSSFSYRISVPGNIDETRIR